MNWSTLKADRARLTWVKLGLEMENFSPHWHPLPQNLLAREKLNNYLLLAIEEPEIAKC